MQIRVLEAQDGSAGTAIATPEDAASDARWVWIDVEASPDDTEDLVEFASRFSLDSLAVSDTVNDVDLPKLDDFDSSMLVVLHGLTEGRISTYEVDCFLSANMLVTIRHERSPSVDVLWSEVQRRPELASGGADELTARLADVLTRRLLTVLDAFDNQLEDLIADALRADPDLVREVTAVRSDVAVVRRAIVPQREALDLLRRSTSPLLSDAARRRFSDVFDVASRAVQGVDAARTALAEVLDAYRGAEARKATEVSKVLTVYAAIMLPLSLIAGFFGMNFDNLPWTAREGGWILVSAAMAVVALVSLGMFVALGWIHRPSGKNAGSALGHGLVEAAIAPAQIVGAVFEISTMPLRSVTRRKRPNDAS